MRKLNILWLICVQIFLFGCSETVVKWEDEWHYIGVSEGKRGVQNYQISSDPSGADVVVDGKFVGRTPIELKLEYDNKSISFKRNKVEIKGDSKKILDEKIRSDDFPQTTAYVVALNKSGYHRAMVAVSVPSETDSVKINLLKKDNITNIRSVFEIDARKEYYPDVERIIAKYSVRSGVSGLKSYSKWPKDPVKLEGGLDVYKQEFHFTVGDSDDFDELVSAMKEMALSRNFVFNILDANFRAKFATNDLGARLDIVLRGSVRPGAELFLMENGSPVPVSSYVDKSGSFAIPIRLHRDARYVYLISMFKGILPVYKMVSVNGSGEKEISEKEFLSSFGLTKKKLFSMLRKESAVSKP